MSKSNYPPGVTDADIARHAGDYKVECPKCQEIVMAYDINEEGICEWCAEETKKEKQS